MLKKLGLHYTVFLTIIVLTICVSHASAALLQHEEESEKEFLFAAAPSKKDAIYKTGDKIKYVVSVDNPFDVVQEGTVSFRVTNTKNAEVAANSIKVNIGKRSSDKFTLDVPFQKDPGFYKIAIMINVSEYDDTLRRTFGVNPREVVSEYPEPGDFDKFWSDARNELRKVKPEFKMTPQPTRSRSGVDVFLVEMKSIDNVTVRGWLSMAKNRKAKQKLPVLVVFPGYGLMGVDAMITTQDMAVFTFNFRGEGNSRDAVRPTYAGFLTDNIEDKKKYILRGAIMDCIRAIDFVCSRPELDTANITASGASLGGFFSIAVASLDKRIKLCSSNNPVFSDWRALRGNADWPMSGLMKYSNARFVKLDKLLDTLDYFDLKNFSKRLECRTVIGIGLLDHLAPPQNQYAMINRIVGEHKVFVYPNLTHEVPPSLHVYVTHWLMDEFGLF
ncbi:hypothetical protein DJ568_05200 [Mucilaginibacter hurinus]|uniref:Acetyl xylan esterase domain-containing protein n=1 Tax=Mucilaginibacter hurinus TaxID=2201324 RepID=A0A367GTV8_9SPHI|nr:acetylxylan esterase [Mucilaginibacter hurinus]RCH56143.1 hypothetical protein DJ568_05200 [Mucilaginibacter hurinus]